MNFLRLNIFLTSTNEWMNMNIFILKQKEPWIHLLILIFIFIWTLFTRTHRETHCRMGECKYLCDIFMCAFIYCNNPRLTDSLSLGLLVGVLAIYYVTLTPCRDSQIIRYAANWISISQLSVNGHGGIMCAMLDLHFVCIFLSCVGG